MPLVVLLLLLCCLPSAAQSPFEKAQVVFLGESHDSERDHQGQLEALKAIRALDDKPMVVLAEMFNESGRQGLESFAEASKFQDFTEDFWNEQWGHPYSLYRPIFRWIKDHDEILLDLRPDPKRTQEVKDKGMVVAVEDLDTVLLGPKAYREKMRAVVAEHIPEGKLPPEEVVNRYFLVQCFWDEYMAWRITEVAQLHPEARLVVLVGHGHLHRDFGIPARLSRRNDKLTWLTVGFGEDQGWDADYRLP